MLSPRILQTSTYNTLPLLKNRQSPSHETNAPYSTLLLILTVLLRMICKKNS